jgi:phosphocarrier protein
MRQNTIQRTGQADAGLADLPRQPFLLMPRWGGVKSGILPVIADGSEWILTETNGPRRAGPSNRRVPLPGPTELPMSHDPRGIRQQVEILNTLGLHMRPAEKFVRLALRFQSEIRVTHNGNQFNGKSILDLTSVGALCGTRLELEARGPDAAEAVAALAELIAARFHEEDETSKETEPTL